jgi:hypothetical protein
VLGIERGSLVTRKGNLAQGNLGKLVGVYTKVYYNI